MTTFDKENRLILLPQEPTLRMLQSGFDALSKIYPPKENGGTAIGQYIVYEAMRNEFIKEMKELGIELL